MSVGECRGGAIDCCGPFMRVSEEGAGGGGQQRGLCPQ